MALVLGCYGAFFPLGSLAFALLTLFAPLWPLPLPHVTKTLWLALGIAVASWLLTSWYYTAPRLPQEGMTGRAFFKVEAILQETPSSARYQGVLENFLPLPEQETLPIRHVPVTLSLKQPLPEPTKKDLYEAEGRLTQRGCAFYHFQGQSDPVGDVQPHHLGWRQRIKNGWETSLRSHVGQGTSYAFLKGLATGQVIDPELQFELGRFGLQHLMAISGFHFTLLAAFLAFLLRAFLKGPCLVLSLCLLLTFYALLMGFSPSLGRAWIASLSLLFGALLERKTTPLNTLGVGMIAMFCISPLSCLQLSFQFSFLCTAAILFFYRPLELALQWLWPQHTFYECLGLAFYQKVAYLILTFIRKSLALTLAVHLAAMPLVLFVFGKFPLMSLLYNLFYPSLAALAFVLLLLAALLTWIPLVSSFFYAMAGALARWMLNLARLLPQRLDGVVEFHLPAGGLVAYGILFLTLGIVLHRQRTRREIRLDDNLGF